MPRIGLANVTKVSALKAKVLSAKRKKERKVISKNNFLSMFNLKVIKGVSEKGFSFEQEDRGHIDEGCNGDYDKKVGERSDKM